MIPDQTILKPESTARTPALGEPDDREGAPMTRRFWTIVLAISAAVVFFFAPRCMASSFQAVEKDQLNKIETKTLQLSDAVEHLQEDIAEELAGVKEKQLFQKADQVLHELVIMDKLLGKDSPAREDLYRQFNVIDGKAMALRKAVPEFAAQHPILQRDADRIRTLSDELHAIVSEGDVSPERFREVLIRQARVMSDVTKTLSHTAEYALSDAMGCGELLADLQKLARASEKFEKALEIPMDIEKCRKEFSSLNDAWGRVVLGMSLLPPKENVFLLRGALRADAIHARLFQVLKIKGERSALTIRI